MMESNQVMSVKQLVIVLEYIFKATLPNLVIWREVVDSLIITRQVLTMSPNGFCVLVTRVHASDSVHTAVAL